MSNLLRCFGKRVSEQRLIKFANTSEENGTSEFMIISTLEHFNMKCSTINSTFKKSFSELCSAFDDGGVAILCVQNLQHWILAIGMVDSKKRIIIIDPARTKKNILENGIRILSKKDLKKIWSSHTSKYFAIIAKTLN